MGLIQLVTSHSNRQVSVSSRSNDDNNVADDNDNNNEDSKQNGDGDNVHNSKNYSNENKKLYVQMAPTVDLNLNGRESVNTQIWNQAKLASHIMFGYGASIPSVPGGDGKAVAAAQQINMLRKQQMQHFC